MKQWALAVMSLGGVLIISSQLVTDSYSLIAAGLSLVVVGVIMFRKDKSLK